MRIKHDHLKKPPDNKVPFPVLEYYLQTLQTSTRYIPLKKMLYFVSSYPENSQKIIELKDMYVGLILSIYNQRKTLCNKLVLHQI